MFACCLSITIGPSSLSILLTRKKLVRYFVLKNFHLNAADEARFKSFPFRNRVVYKLKESWKTEQASFSNVGEGVIEVI